MLTLFGTLLNEKMNKSEKHLDLIAILKLPGYPDIKKMNYKFKFYLKVLKFVSEHSFI